MILAAKIFAVTAILYCLAKRRPRNHLWGPFEHGAASSSPEMLAGARRHFRIATIFHAFGSVLIWFLVVRHA
jgi:ABC-type Na+ efflux pump permease subunit